MVVIEDHTKEYMTDEGEQKEDVTIMMKKDAEDDRKMTKWWTCRTTTIWSSTCGRC